MQLIDRYLARNIIIVTLLVSLILFSLELFIALAGEFNDLGIGHYNLWQALQFVLLNGPRQFYNLFPMAGLIGVLLSLGMLATHNELVAIQASGISRAQIAWVVLQVAALMVVIATVIGEWIAPYTENYAQLKKSYALSFGQQVIPKGFWIRDKGSIVHAKAILPDGSLNAISRFDFDDAQHLTSISFAEHAEYQQHHWVLQNVSQTLFQAGKTIAYNTPQAIWDIELNPKVLQITNLDPEQLSLKQINTSLHFLKKNALQSDVYGFAFWKRVLQPVATLVMMFLALPFIFGPLRGVTMGVRIVVGILVGFGFFILNAVFASLGIFLQAPPWLAVSFPILMFAVLAYVVLHRNRMQ